MPSKKHHNVLFLIVNVMIVVVMGDLPGKNCQDFNSWKEFHRQTYYNDEYERYRARVFEENCKEIARHNMDPLRTFDRGDNRFTGLTKEEFKKSFLGLVKPERPIVYEYMFYLVRPTERDDLLKAYFDWLAQGVVTPPLDQGYCGSCWAFATVGAVESYLAIQNGIYTLLSQQQLVDCPGVPYNSFGCQGGYPPDALRYIQKYGISQAGVYPYIATTQPCQKPTGYFRINGLVELSGCDNLAKMLRVNPVIVGVDADGFESYSTGLYNNCTIRQNHAILLVAKTATYWKVKNSWGVGWGYFGYVRFPIGNSCGICDSFSLPHPTIPL